MKAKKFIAIGLGLIGIIGLIIYCDWKIALFVYFLMWGNNLDQMKWGE